MNTDYIFLNPAPMPYLTDCDYKKFEPNEYHISRIVDFFVLIFMLRGSLHFIEDDVSVSVQEGEWYIQRKNLLQGADRPSTGENIASSAGAYGQHTAIMDQYDVIVLAPQVRSYYNDMKADTDRLGIKLLAPRGKEYIDLTRDPAGAIKWLRENLD